MAGKLNEPKYRSTAEVTPHPVDWNSENDLDYTTPYPCGVCGRHFTSRYSLATHKHQRKAR